MAEFVIRGAGAVIARHRKNQKLTLEALAIQAGLEKSQIAKYESNKVGITDEKLERIAKALGMTPEQFAYECLIEIKPELQSKRIGKLLGSLVQPTTPPKTSAAKNRKATVAK